MKINKLTASFGKLENETLSFHDGLNVIYAPNESGKSTWCAFILAMLYGVDSSERAKAGYLPDKLRYAPWSGAPMEGTMELRADGCDITISRTTRAKNAPMREFSATYTGTSTPVRELNGANAGELLTGVSKEVFRRSAFMAQGSVAVTGAPELEKRISSIVSTGEEQTSYTEADEALRSWQRKRRYNRRGYLPELEGQIDEAQRRLEEMSGAMDALDALEGQLDRAREDCVKLEQAVNDSRKKQRRDALNALSAGQDKLRRSSEAHDAAMSALSEKREELRRGGFGGRSADEVEATINADLESFSALSASAKKKANPLLAILMFIIAAAGAALYIRFQQIPYVIVSVIACIAAIAFFFRVSSVKQNARKAQDRRREILLKYEVTSPSELREKLENYRALWDEVSECERLERQTRAEYESAQDALGEMQERTLQELDFSTGSSEAAQLGRELAAARSKAERLAAQSANISGRLAAMGDPLVLSSSLSCLKEEYETISQEYDALSLAISTLKEADSEMQSRFSPELGRVAAKYMSLVTGGRYSELMLSRDFSAKTRTQDDIVARDAEYLSSGTLDLMYLAVRLAVCKLALPEGESCPLIIDDALVNLDNDRLSQAMKLLREIATERQVILFTCRELT